MQDMKDVLKEVDKGMKEFLKDTPEEMTAFAAFMKAVEIKGALSSKDKELIAVALSVATHCKWCIAFHVKEALNQGATDDEIREAAWMAVFMGGGPSLMYAQLVLKALEDFKK